MPNPFSRRTQTVDPPEPVSPLTGQPFGKVANPNQAAEDEARAAGQLALAGATYAGPVRAGAYRPRDCAWAGTRP